MRLVPSIDLVNGRSRLVFWPGAASGTGTPTDRPEKIATAFVSPLGAADDEAVVKALNGHAKFIRGRATHALRQMKYMPEFRFRLDTSFDNFAKIDELLKSPEVAK